jgi:hypothetical protein
MARIAFRVLGGHNIKPITLVLELILELMWRDGQLSHTLSHAGHALGT